MEVRYKMAIWQKGGVKGRIKLKNRSGIDAKVTIFDVRGDEATLGNTSVLLEDISLEGLQFLSYLRFPVNTDYRLRFTITLGEWEFALLGQVMWRSKQENMFAYGCRFEPDADLKKALSVALQQQIRSMCPNHHRIHYLYQRFMERQFDPKQAAINKSV